MRVEAEPNADSFKEPTLNQNVISLTPQNRPILRSSNLSLAGDLQESIPKVVILVHSEPFLDYRSKFDNCCQRYIT